MYQTKAEEKHIYMCYLVTDLNNIVTLKGLFCVKRSFKKN
jgi:hypothetical protein